MLLGFWRGVSATMVGPVTQGRWHIVWVMSLTCWCGGSAVLLGFWRGVSATMVGPVTQGWWHIVLVMSLTCWCGGSAV